MAEKRVVCLNCIDGRVQRPVIDYIETHYQADYVDMITEPGMDGFLANEQNDLLDVFRKIKISIDKNNAAMIFVVGHHDCQGNPADELEHKACIVAAAARVKHAFPQLGVEGVWIDHAWQGKKIEV